MPEAAYTVRPIGFVRSPIQQPADDCWAGLIATANRIGITTCKIEKVDGLRISVRELDAVDGSPVLDIKPYVAEFGPREPVRQAAWSRELMAGYFKSAK